MVTVATYAKAVVGAVVAGLTAMYGALDDNIVTQKEWIVAVTAFLTALSVIWAVPNQES